MFEDWTILDWSCCLKWRSISSIRSSIVFWVSGLATSISFDFQNNSSSLWKWSRPEFVARAQRAEFGSRSKRCNWSVVNLCLLLKWMLLSIPFTLSGTQLLVVFVERKLWLISFCCPTVCCCALNVLPSFFSFGFSTHFFINLGRSGVGVVGGNSGKRRLISNYYLTMYCGVLNFYLLCRRVIVLVSSSIFSEVMLDMLVVPLELKEMVIHYCCVWACFFVKQYFTLCLLDCFCFSTSFFPLLKWILNQSSWCCCFFVFDCFVHQYFWKWCHSCWWCPWNRNKYLLIIMLCIVMCEITLYLFFSCAVFLLACSLSCSEALSEWLVVLLK